MLRLNNITVKYGDSTVLDSFSCDLSDSRITAICGASGCGKTTLLRVICGISKPTSGRVETDKTFSCMFQDSALFPHLTALENVNVVLSDKKETLPKAKEFLQKTGLFDFDKYPDQLSGGMKQRVALARALAFDADVLLLDEPFSALDKESKQQRLSLLEKDGRQVIFVTHDPSDTEIADNIINL